MVDTVPKTATWRTTLARLGLAAGALIAVCDLLFTVPVLSALLVTHWRLLIGVATLVTSALFLVRSGPHGQKRFEEKGEAWVLGEMNYYSGWLTRHAAAFSALKILSLLCAAAIPVLAAILKESDIKTWAALLGATVVFSEGMLQVFRYQENWINGASTRGILERELARFRVGAVPYDKSSGEQRVALLVQRAVDAISAEYSTWSTNLLRRENANANPHSTEETKQEPD